MTLSLFRDDPFFRDVDRFFDMTPRMFRGMGMNQGQGMQGSWAPSCDVFDAGDHLRIQAELPGVSKDKVSCEIDKQGNLLIEGETCSEKETEGMSSRLRERRVGRFQRIVGLPSNVDPNNVEANFKDGILDVKIRKSGGPERQRININ